MFKQFQDLFQIDQVPLPHHHQPKLKKQYAAGFRKYQYKKQDPSPAIPTLNNYSHQNPSQTLTNEVIQYIRSLNVDNLSNLYYESVKNRNQPDLQKIKQQQLKSVTRLYQNLYPKRSSQQNQPQPPQSQSTNKKYSKDVWSKDQKFKHQPVQFIINNQLLKLHKKTLSQLKSICKNKNIEPLLDFSSVFACFILKQCKNLLSVLSKQLSLQEKDMEIFYMWKSFLNITTLTTINKKYSSQTITKQNLTQLRKQSTYLYSIILPNISTDPINFQTLKNLIQNQLKIPIAQIISNFNINKQYTNPYNIEYNKPNQKLTNTNNNNQNQQQEQYPKFKANTIPKSTYKQPPQQKKKQTKQTILKPFNLTSQHPPISPQQYYHWNHQFKANPIPSTTYNPQKPNLMSQQQKKVRSILTLKNSKYPTTMENLNNYTQNKQQKISHLAQKYAKHYSKSTHQEIPNFNYLHAQAILQLQQLKQKNKKTINVQPFHLSDTKPRPTTAFNYQIANPNISKHPSIPKHPQRKNQKSTKKFDAYINYRKKQQNNKIKTLQQKQQAAKQQNKKKQPFINIIKSRVQEELNAHPVKKKQHDQHSPIKVEIDKQKIYREAPLLMKSSLPQQQCNLPWDPIF